MIDLSKLHSMVWTFRRETESHFPIPGKRDSLRFAFTEAGEAVDAYLREGGDYLRNRDKDHSEMREWAQCLFMLLTAWGPEQYNGMYRHQYNLTLNQVALYVAETLVNNDPNDINRAVRTICQYVGPTIEDELADALDALRAKHLTQEVTL